MTSEKQAVLVFGDSLVEVPDQEPEDPLRSWWLAACAARGWPSCVGELTVEQIAELRSDAEWQALGGA